MTRPEERDARITLADIARAYEFAGGDTWDDLLQYFESDPTEDFESLSKQRVRSLTERIRALAQEGGPYPKTPEELRRLLNI